MVERFFAEITRNRIRRGAFKSVAELKNAIMQYLEKHNANPKPFAWTKSADKILEKVARAKQALESQHERSPDRYSAPTSVTCTALAHVADAQSRPHLSLSVAK
jgi:hypothetical protein